jgi:hypothetical protein
LKKNRPKPEKNKHRLGDIFNKTRPRSEPGGNQKVWLISYTPREGEWNRRNEHELSERTE